MKAHLVGKSGQNMCKMNGAVVSLIMNHLNQNQTFNTYNAHIHIIYSDNKINNNNNNNIKNAHQRCADRDNAPYANDERELVEFANRNTKINSLTAHGVCEQHNENVKKNQQTGFKVRMRYLIFIIRQRILSLLLRFHSCV